MEQFRLHWNHMPETKQILSLLVDLYEDGAVFLITDREKVIYKKASSKFDFPNITEGTSERTAGLVDHVLKNKQVMQINVDQHLFGVRASIVAGPLWSDDEQEILGIWILALPRIHKMVGAFDIFAPIITEMLPEGGIMYLADKEKVIKKQGSSKFDTDWLKTGIPLKEGDLPLECIKSNKHLKKDIPPETYGVVTETNCYPLIDEETNEVVGAFGLALPRELQVQLKNMAENLGRGLQEISAAMEEMAASATEVSQNQDILHREIEKVRTDAHEINTVLAFIKEIADETKMLGLNAAIEAARAGEAGRGFGVVAEEIRKLSDESKQTVVQIRELLERVDASINQTSKFSDATLDNTQQVAAATEEVNASLEEMTALAEHLDATASKL